MLSLIPVVEKIAKSTVAARKQKAFSTSRSVDMPSGLSLTPVIEKIAKRAEVAKKQ